MIPVHSKINWSGNENLFSEIGELAWKDELIPVCLANNIFNFHLNREVSSTQTNNVNNSQQSGNEDGRALVSPTQTLNRDVAPIGDDIEPVGESRADVEMGNEEDEEPLEAEIPRVRMNPKNPTSRDKQEHEDSGHAVYSAARVEGHGVGGQHRIELLEEKRKNNSDCGFRQWFLATRKCRHDSISDLSRQQVWSNGSDVL